MGPGGTIAAVSAGNLTCLAWTEPTVIERRENSDRRGRIFVPQAQVVLGYVPGAFPAIFQVSM